MIEQAGVEIIWYAHFTEGGEGQTGLSPAITVYKDDGGTPEVNAANMTELADGFYTYKQTPSGEGFRVAVAKTTDADADQKHVPAVMLIGKAGVEQLDASVSTRAAEATVAKEASLTAIKGAGWASASDTLEKIREAIANVPAQRQTQEL